MAETATDRPNIPRLEPSFQKGRSKPPWHRQGPTATPESWQEAPRPIHRITPTVLLGRPLRGSAVTWPPAQAALSQPQLQPSAQDPQPQPSSAPTPASSHTAQPDFKKNFIEAPIYIIFGL